MYGALLILDGTNRQPHVLPIKKNGVPVINMFVTKHFTYGAMRFVFHHRTGPNQSLGSDASIMKIIRIAFKSCKREEYAITIRTNNQASFYTIKVINYMTTTGELP